MGKRRPYECIVPGCAKRGTMSGLKQHIAEKHPELRHRAVGVIEASIEHGRKIAMDTPHFPASPSEYQKLIAYGRAMMLRGVLIGAVVGGLSFTGLALLIFKDCQHNLTNFCPPSIARMINGR